MSKKKTKTYWTLSKSIEKANEIGVEVSKPTLIKWIKRYALGFQLGDEGGKWYLYPQKFMRYINGGKTETGKNPNIILIKPDEEESKKQK